MSNICSAYTENTEAISSISQAFFSLTYAEHMQSTYFVPVIHVTNFFNMCNILDITFIHCAYAQYMLNIYSAHENTEDIEASNNISFKDSMCICHAYAVYVKTIIISKNYMNSLSNSAYACVMAPKQCSELAHTYDVRSRTCIAQQGCSGLFDLVGRQ